MLKSLELSDPKSCINKAADDEPVFVLLARDVAAPSVIRLWVAERIRMGKNGVNDPQILNALSLAHSMQDYRQAVAIGAGDRL